MNNNNKTTKFKMKKLYVITYVCDSCEPIVYGPFTTYEKAKKQKDKMYKEFTQQDWNNEAQLDVTQIQGVK